MASSNFALFHGIPALYAPLPSRLRQRRTATNIMAGCFDPHPALPPDSPRDDCNNSLESILTTITQEEVLLETALAGIKQKGNAKGNTLTSTKRPKVPATATKRVPPGKGKQVKRLIPEEKENSMSHSDSSLSVSSTPPPPARTTLPSTESNKPKASGFWRAHSNNISEGVSSPGKRKHFSFFKNDSSSSPPQKRASKKSRPPEYVTTNNVSGILSPYSDSLTSLEAEPQDAAPDQNNAATIKRPSVTEDKKRGQRKNVAIKKGWKGWVEEDLEPQKLILLDKPEVLPERTTRSGRKID